MALADVICLLEYAQKHLGARCGSHRALRLDLYEEGLIGFCQVSNRKARNSSLMIPSMLRVWLPNVQALAKEQMGIDMPTVLLVFSLLSGWDRSGAVNSCLSAPFKKSRF